MDKLTSQLQAKREELAAFQAKYKIRFKVRFLGSHAECCNCVNEVVKWLIGGHMVDKHAF